MSRHAAFALKVATGPEPPPPVTLPRTRDEALDVLKETARQIRAHAAEPPWRDADGVVHGFTEVMPEHDDYYALLVLLGVTGE